MRLQFLAVALVLNALAATASERKNPYTCEGIARDLGARLSLAALKKEASARADAARRAQAEAENLEKDVEQARRAGKEAEAQSKSVEAQQKRLAAAIGFCTVAESQKRLGASSAGQYYESAIENSADEPAFELLFGDYLRLYRGAGQRPLFQEAEKHLFAARGKLFRLANRENWDKSTEERIQRSLTALYERDGVHLASWKWKGDEHRADVRRPWLFFSPGVRWEQSDNDFDRTSDIRDRTSEAAFSASPSRLNRPLTQAELDSLVRLMTPLEGTGRLRIRYESAPIIDVFVTDRTTGDAQVTNFYQPGRFNELKLLDFGAALEKPFAISGNTDADVRFAYHRVDREGLIEFLPQATEKINQFEASGALSQYAGPDRFNLAYTYVRQNIDPEVTGQLSRDREIMGGTATYQIFRPIPLFGRNLETGLGRKFQTRGIDLYGGVLNDDERYPSSPVNTVFVTRRDYFAGINARGLGRMDFTIQPTWYTSSVSNDPSQYNSQLRTQGNVLFRLLDEERSGGIPKERLLGLPVAFVQLVVPFHYDTPRQGSDSFRSRRLGAELWVKCFTKSDIGVTTLSVVGYSRQWFPGLNKDLNLLRVGFSVGF